MNSRFLLLCALTSISVCSAPPRGSSSYPKGHRFNTQSAQYAATRLGKTHVLEAVQRESGKKKALQERRKSRDAKYRGIAVTSAREAESKTIEQNIFELEQRLKPLLRDIVNRQQWSRRRLQPTIDQDEREQAIFAKKGWTRVGYNEKVPKGDNIVTYQGPFYLYWRSFR